MSEIAERLGAALADRYSIEGELGAGGMATVYRAHDLKHERKVALKVLRPELTAVLGVKRFLGEIRLTANLQHPHILPLFDSGEVEGLLFYVMPYIEGESLRDRLEQERELAVEEAMAVATQVAHALDYAHRHDVVHRDIKPENILLHDGQAVVADFGIALAVRAAGGDRVTQTGLSLGTPQYMSPEQATADRELDARSDIYSLGAVTYEMLVGEPPYTGPSTQAIVAKIITEDPRLLGERRRSVPEHVAATVHKALEKLPADRFETAADFAEALSKPGLVTARPTSVAVSAVQPTGFGKIARLAWPAAAALAVVAAIGGWLREPATNSETPVARFVITLPASEQLGEAAGRLIAVAPDGTGFVYVGVGSEGRRLYFRPFDRFAAVPIQGTEGASWPFFSPDSRWVGFLADGAMKKVALGGGTPVTIQDGTYAGASWGRDGFIVFSPPDRAGLFRIPADGGTPERVTTPVSIAGEIDHLAPDVVTDVRAVFFTVAYELDTRIAVASLETGEVKYLAEGLSPRYAAGHLVWRTEDGLKTAGFDARRLELSGPVISVESDVGATGSGVSNFALSRDGSLIYLTGDETQRALVIVDRQGRERVLSPQLRGFDAPRFSPDGRSVALRIEEGGFHIWVYEIGRGTFSRLTFVSNNFYPEWSPDGRRVSFITVRAGSPDLFWRPADGSGSAEPLLATELSQWEIAWAPDGKSLVYRQNDPQTGRDLWVLPLEGDRQPSPLFASPDQERAARVSPDGRYVAYVSDESGRSEVYVGTFAESGAKWQISTEGGTEPLWSPDAREIFYRRGDELVAVTVETQPVFRVGASQVLFEGPYVPNPHHTNYDIHPDGDRFIMVRSAEGERQVVVVLNWTAELEGRAKN